MSTGERTQACAADAEALATTVRETLGRCDWHFQQEHDRAVAALDTLLGVLRASEQRAEMAQQATEHERARSSALRRALSEHHAVGVMDGVLVGDECPVCKRWLTTRADITSSALKARAAGECR